MKTKLGKSNVHYTGKGMDSNGNSVVKVIIEGQKRGFSIQTNGNLPETHSIIKSRKSIRKLSDKEIISMEKEIVNYIKEFGSKSQKKLLKVSDEKFSEGGEVTYSEIRDFLNKNGISTDAGDRLLAVEEIGEKYFIKPSDIVMAMSDDTVFSAIDSVENDYELDLEDMPRDAGDRNSAIDYLSEQGFGYDELFRAMSDDDVYEAIYYVLQDYDLEEEYAKGGIVLSDIEALIDEINENNTKGETMYLGGAYGHYELWKKFKDTDGESRLEAGSKRDIYNYLIKNRFKYAKGGEVDWTKLTNQNKIVAYFDGTSYSVCPADDIRNGLVNKNDIEEYYLFDDIDEAYNFADEENDKMYSKGGNIKSDYFVGLLSFLNW